jgi:hypothetical protein
MMVRVGLGYAAALACVLAAVFAAVLAACSSAAAAPAPADSCRLAITSRYVGARAVPTVRKAIRAIARPRSIRWIRPGQAITTDYSAQRLNVIIDESGRIMAMRCG